MTTHFCIDYELPHLSEFDLDRWASAFTHDSDKFTKDGGVWQLTNDRNMELGNAIQCGHRIYVRWHYSSFGPRQIWLATQLVAELLDLNATISIAPCSIDTYKRAEDGLSDGQT